MLCLSVFILLGVHVEIMFRAQMKINTYHVAVKRIAAFIYQEMRILAIIYCGIIFYYIYFSLFSQNY